MSSYAEFEKVEERTKTYVSEHIDSQRSQAAQPIELDTSLLPNFESKHAGKVRDVYACGDKVVIVATNRQSAFDRHLASIPFKGGVLNMTSAWWFEQTKHIVPNHVISCPHASVMIGKKCTVFPIEFVMRGYITGSTSTSLWTHYKQGVRQYCGHSLPEGLQKNQILAKNLLTPTTKDAVHDELISAEEIVSSGRMTQEDWDATARYAHELFAFSQQKAAEKGMILVDTKYEFGKDSEGNIVLLDEIQTPDSSRFWIASSYKERFNAGQEPENVDKEFLRLWFAANCDPYKDAVLPEAPSELVNELSRRYIMLYEVITGEQFDFTKALGNPAEVQASVLKEMQV